MNKEDKKRYGHPTIKPLPMIDNFIKNSTGEGDVILDPFFGSGTTGVACVQNGRDFIGIEIDPKYCEIAERRIAQARREGKQTTLFDGGTK